jgi:metacaspase-1
MCFKRKSPPVVITGSNICLTYNINNYVGKDNDLNGCISDGRNLDGFLLNHYPMFKTTRIIDSEVTRRTFHDLTKNTIVSAVPGDFIIIHYSGHGSFGLDPTKTEADGYSECLYLYDGPFWDREFMEILALIPDGVKVVVMLDSCFSFGATTRKLRNPYNKPRFIQFQDINPEIPIRRNILHRTSLKHVLLAGCQERQTSADAYINGVGYVGAFTYFLLKAWRREYNYNQWIDDTVYRINKAGFEQVPGILGNKTLIDQVILT